MAEGKFDLLLKGGRVIDPANKVNGLCDVGIVDDKIAKVETDIDTKEADHVIDVSDLLITPGLIDIHIHAYFTRAPGEGLFSASLNPDAHSHILA